MADKDRLSALCELGERTDDEGNPIPPPVTGIDFIQVVDPEVQTVLRVFFIIDPDRLADPLATVPGALDLDRISIVSTSGGADVQVLAADWRSVAMDGDARTALEINTDRPGDFSLYRLTIDDPDHDPPRVDRFFNGVVFSFKQGCPSVLDCRERERECPPEEWVDFPVDYLARDFTSLRGALLDFAAQRYPEWSEAIEADAGVMLAEVMAALGDELSYIQDRYAREAYLETATQRRSLRWHTRLVDFSIDHGRAATTNLALHAGGAGSPGKFVRAGTRVWAPGEADARIPFEIGAGLKDRRRFWIHTDWDEIPAHVPDPSEPCLQAGSTELFLVGRFPESGQLPPAGGEDRDDDGDWVGRLVLLKTAPEDPSLPERRHFIHVTEVGHGLDLIRLDDEDNPIPYTRIAWDASEAPPFDMFLPATAVCANIVPAIAGETFKSHFVIGKSEAATISRDVDALVDRVGLSPDEAEDFVARRQQLPAAVERQGPCNELIEERTPVYLFSLPETEERGLSWLGRNREAEPEIELTEDPGDAREAWSWQPDLLGSTSENEVFTLDHGTWRPIFSVRRRNEIFEHEDYAGGDGFTVRFGEFARVPAKGTVFRARYRTGAGAGANVPDDTVTVIDDPDPHPDPARRPPTLRGLVESVTNPLPVTTGADPQSTEIVKQHAPEAFKAETFRAVRDEDYRAQAEEVEGVQRAGASARWTGSWLSEFVTADPLGAFRPSEALTTRIANRLDCVRQVGREVYVTDPEYLDIDLEVEICIEPFAYPGQVQEAVVQALTVTPAQRGREAPPFFHPDNFTFGTPLRRADLEAAVQAVPGVLAVLRTWIRARGVTRRRELSELEFPVAANRIIRLQNDPRYPERGSLKVIVKPETRELH